LCSTCSFWLGGTAALSARTTFAWYIHAPLPPRRTIKVEPAEIEPPSTATVIGCRARSRSTTQRSRSLLPAYSVPFAA
jgi:hypothetical protein